MCCSCKQAVERHWGSSPSLLQSDSLVFLFPCASREEEPVCYPFDRLDCPAEPHTNPPSPTEDLFSPHGLRATCTDHKPRGSLEVLNLKSIAGWAAEQPLPWSSGRRRRDPPGARPPLFPRRLRFHGRSTHRLFSGSARRWQQTIK